MYSSHTVVHHNVHMIACVLPHLRLIVTVRATVSNIIILTTIGAIAIYIIAIAIMILASGTAIVIIFAIAIVFTIAVISVIIAALDALINLIHVVATMNTNMFVTRVAMMDIDGLRWVGGGGADVDGLVCISCDNDGACDDGGVCAANSIDQNGSRGGDCLIAIATTIVFYHDQVNGNHSPSS